MKICIDVRCLSEGRRTGVEEYTFNLLSNLFEIDKDNQYALFFNSWKKSKADFSWIEKYPNVSLKKFSFPNKILNFSFWYLGWPKIDKMVGGVDVVFMPNIIFGSVSRRAKLILTVHDLSFERYPEYFSRKRRWWHIFINPKKMCRRADKIIAVSYSTKNDIANLYKILPDKIAAIHSAVADKFRIISHNDEKLVKIKEKYNLPYKFILSLGTIEPRKNITGIVKAYNALQKYAAKQTSEVCDNRPRRSVNIEEILKYKLVIAGESGWANEKIFEEIRKSPYKNNIQIINSVPDEDKEYFYNLSSLFVYPSFFEGFGFPPLEAMKCGVPVICSNNSSLPEIAGEAAIMVYPDKPEEICQAMKEILTDQNLRENLIQKGLQKSAKFSWLKTAKETLKIF